MKRFLIGFGIVIFLFLLPKQGKALDPLPPCFLEIVKSGDMYVPLDNREGMRGTCNAVFALEVDAEGNIYYLSESGGIQDVCQLSPDGDLTLLDPAPGEILDRLRNLPRRPVVTDSAGNRYTVSDDHQIAVTDAATGETSTLIGGGETTVCGRDRGERFFFPLTVSLTATGPIAIRGGEVFPNLDLYFESCDLVQISRFSCGPEPQNPPTGCPSCPSCPVCPSCPEPSERPSIPAASVCGNGIVEEGEMCDDGNSANGDGCSAACKKERRRSSRNPQMRRR